MMSQELTPRLHPASGTVTIPDTVIPHGGIVHGGEINLSLQLTLITVYTSFSLNFDGTLYSNLGVVHAHSHCSSAT
jgi:hypothetical protein